MLVLPKSLNQLMLELGSKIKVARRRKRQRSYKVEFTINEKEASLFEAWVDSNVNGGMF